MNTLFSNAKNAARTVALLSDEQRNAILLDVAQAIVTNTPTLLSANANDLEKMSLDNPLYDRLMLTEERLKGIAGDMQQVAHLPSPPSHTIEDRTLPNGLRLRRVSVPFGVIGVIYEARPNVTFDVFSLCLKSGNACILKGGKDADSSNREAIAVIREVLSRHARQLQMPDLANAATLLDATHEATAELLNAVGYVDICIPRGGRKLIDFVRDNAKVPVIETGAGVVNCYFDATAQTEMGTRIIENAKTRRVSVCNALDCLLINASRISDLPTICAPLKEKHVTIYADDTAYSALEASGYTPLQHATTDSYGTEFMDYKLAVKTVSSIGEAIDHIAKYGSGHSESIITEDPDNADRFQREVDAACVYVNAPTSFTDGAQFGLGAEIGISTQKLGARGPMGLREMTTYKWLINGEGQIRKA
ncbi:MAG: glutamate-5-semialdehyde dehydrogenase [Bacteroidaceae bacterium]|nr:glutamate-5-semialdehyde dehydrogenase [Bacteroidaceae bacterium]